MKKRHSALGDSATKAIAHNQLGAIEQLSQKSRDVGEVIAIVGVAHHNIATFGYSDAALQSIAVAFFGHIHQARSTLLGDLLRTVRAAVVRDDYFATNTGLA